MQTAREWPNSTIYGTGLTPEGINQNYVMYDFMLDLSYTLPQDINIPRW